MVSSNLENGHADTCALVMHPKTCLCNCGYDLMRTRAAKRQAEADATKASRAATEAADRREKERAEEQAFWDRAFCAALGGAWANESLLIVTDDHRKKTGEAPADFLARQMSEMADAALSARRSRQEGDKAE